MMLVDIVLCCKICKPVVHEDWYLDGVGNTVLDYYSVISVIQMRYLLSAGACGHWAVKLCSNRIFCFLTGALANAGRPV